MELSENISDSFRLNACDRTNCNASNRAECVTVHLNGFPVCSFDDISVGRHAVATYLCYILDV
jgi:hypothetical protein